MYQITFYVPESHLDVVKEAMFKVGAGKIGNYSKCCWQTKGQGQFLAEAGSDPHTGSQGTVSQVDEYKVELVCLDEVVKDVVAAMKQAHPYEEPAYQVFKLENLENI